MTEPERLTHDRDVLVAYMIGMTSKLKDNAAYRRGVRSVLARIERKLAGSEDNVVPLPRPRL